jgi:hypothetical protein
MKASDIFHKTSKGLVEIKSRSNALTPKQRRVLILVNGTNNASTLKELSRCDNIVEILESLLSHGFIDDGTTTRTDYDYAAKAPAKAKVNSEADTGARTFMCNTLLTFANRVRVGKLIDEINAANNIDSLKSLLNPWYQAISETPGGMYQADDLRQEVLRLIENEDLDR